MPNTRAGNLLVFLLRSEEKTVRETLILACRCLACRSMGQRSGGDQISLVELFFFFLYHQTAGLRTPFNPIKDDEQSQQARGVRDEVLQGHHQWSPLSLLNC